MYSNVRETKVRNNRRLIESDSVSSDSEGGPNEHKEP